jgi:hypothetical protein
MFRYGAEHPDGDGKWTCPNCGDGNGQPEESERQIDATHAELRYCQGLEILEQHVKNVERFFFEFFSEGAIMSDTHFLLGEAPYRTLDQSRNEALPHASTHEFADRAHHRPRSKPRSSRRRMPLGIPFDHFFFSAVRANQPTACSTTLHRG